MSSINDEFLKSIVASFPPIEFAFAYGSGAISQKGYEDTTIASSSSSSEDAPQLDIIFAVQDPLTWHEANLKQNPQHYSALQYFGAAYITKVQDQGPGLYFNPFVDFNGLQLKYGVVSTKRLLKDLTEWDSLYLSGRLHKPVRFIEHLASPVLIKQMSEALSFNRTAAFSLACLMMTPPFSELELYQRIAALSYTGKFIFYCSYIFSYIYIFSLSLSFSLSGVAHVHM